MPKKVPLAADELTPSLSPEQRLIKSAKANYNAAMQGWRRYTNDAKDCLKYVEGDYMPSSWVATQEANALPALTEDRIPKMVAHETNQFLESIPAIQISPADDNTDEEFADNMSDMIRTIEQDSHAKVAYGKAGWYSIVTGLGYVRVNSEYVSTDSFEQRLKIDAVVNPFTILLDPNHQSLTGADAEYAFVVVEMTHDEYLRKYGRSKLAEVINQNSFQGWTKNDTNSWLTTKFIRVMEYYVKEYYEQKLWKIWNPAGYEQLVFEQPPAGTKIIDQRVAMKPVIKHYVLNDREILDETEWPGEYIPIIAFKGEEFWNPQDERVLKGMVYDLRDSQRRIDYINNTQLEMLMLAPKAPYIGTAKQFEDNQAEWATLHTSHQAYITYKPDPANGGAPPQRDVAELPIQSAQVMLVNATEALKAVSGQQAPDMGENGPQNAESGRALLTRVEQARISNFHRQHNIRQSIAQVGLVLVQAIPVFYGEAGRSIIGTKQNGDQQTFVLNNSIETKLENAKFKVAVETGGAYATKRQAAMDAGMQLIGVYPEAAPLIADLIAQNADWPGAQEIAARLRAAVPPNVLAATDDQVEEGPQQIANLKQQVQGLTQQVQEMEAQVLPDKTQIQKLSFENAVAKNDNELEAAKIKLTHQEKMAELDLKRAELQVQQETLIAQMEVKRVELELQERELELTERKFEMEVQLAGIKATEQMQDQHHKARKEDREDKLADLKSASVEVPSVPDLDSVEVEGTSNLNGPGDGPF